MPDSVFRERLSGISTKWTLLFQAHVGAVGEREEARRQFLQTYARPVYRYLLGAVRKADIADELYQEFALRFVRGDFQSVDRHRGRFRSFLKTVLYHLIVDHQRRQKRQPLPLPEPGEIAGAPEAPLPSDAEFLDVWRRELMDRAWEELEQLEQETGQVLHSVLRLRLEHPDLDSTQLAEQYCRQHGKSVQPGWFRKRLHLAREKLVELLVAEVTGCPGSS